MNLVQLIKDYETQLTITHPSPHTANIDLRVKVPVGENHTANIHLNRDVEVKRSNLVLPEEETMEKQIPLVIAQAVAVAEKQIKVALAQGPPTDEETSTDES